MRIAKRSSQRTLVADAQNGQDVVIFAPRRLGKSSLISAAMRQLIHNDVLVADIDLWKIPTKEKARAGPRERHLRRHCPTP